MYQKHVGSKQLFLVSGMGAQIPKARSPKRLNYFTVAPNICGYSKWNFM
jgi:hypothetical protein